MQSTSFGLSILCMATAACVSCTSSKRIAYFQDISDSLTSRARLLQTTPFQEPVILPDDRLHITLRNINALDYSGFTGVTDSASPESGVSSASEFLVDHNGRITIPLIGSVNLSGLTTAAAKDTVQSRFAHFFNEPVVSLHIANFTITVLGEVSRPSTYLVAKEKISVLDALGMAGDMTIYGKRENVLLIRNSSADKEAIRLDLSSSSIMRSPYFYLKQGDVLYVEPNKSKMNALDATKTRNYALMASGLSVLIVLVSRLNF